MMRIALGACLALALGGCGAIEDEVAPIDQARAALAAGDGLGAEVILRQMLADGTAPEDIAAYLGEAELQQGQLLEARKWLGDGRFSGATAAHGYRMLGRLEIRTGNLPAAGAALDRSYLADPENPGLWVDIGRLRYRGGEQKQAIEASMRAVELGPDNPEALLLRAQLVRDSEGLAAALPWFEAGLEAAPDDLDLLGDYAATLGDMGRAKDMLAVVRHMAVLDDRDPRIFLLQATLAARAGEFGLARTLLSRAGPSAAENPAGMLLSGVVDIRNGNFQSAAQMLDRLALIQPDNRQVRALLAHALAQGLNERELDYRYSERSRLPGALPYLQLVTGRSLEALGRRDEASDLLDRAANPRMPDLVAVESLTPVALAEVRRNEGGSAIQALVRGMIRSGRLVDAIAEAEAFRRRFPGSADALTLAGDARLAARQPKAAIDLYHKALAIRRSWPLTRRMMVALSAQGRTAEARSLVHDYLVGDPGNGEASAELARFAVMDADWQQAGILLEHAIDHGHARDPEIWRLRARVAMAQADPDLAFDSAVYAYALQPMSRQATATLLEIAEARGERGLAGGLKRKLARLPA